MSIIYFMTARQAEEVKGISTELVCEFEQGGSPKIVTFNGSGQHGDVYVNLNGVCDVEKGVLLSLNGVSIPAGYVGELEARIEAFKTQIASDQG